MVSFRNLQKKDIIEVRKIALKSWRFAYKNIYKDKTIKRMVSDYYSEKNFEKELNQIKFGKGKFILAVESNKIWGYAHVSKIKNTWEVIRIYVDPKKVRKGIGTELLKRVENFLKRKGAKKYTIYPHVKNKIAVNFYIKSGFVRESKFDRGWNSPCYVKKI